MTYLRQIMLEELQRRNCAESTIETYIQIPKVIPASGCTLRSR